MSYDLNGGRNKSFSWPSLPCFRIFTLLMLLLFIVLSSLPLDAASLVYDHATGNLTGFWMGRVDSPDNASKYAGKTGEYYKHSGYVGRLLYTGGPTTLTFSKVGGKNATGTGVREKRFYFTNVNDCSKWREFGLVLRAKGLRHDGAKIDFYGQCYAIVEHLDTFTLVSQGAGDELVELGEFGYDGYGKSGIYTVENDYKYKYEFSLIWIDVTIIHSYNISSSYLWKDGYYESNIEVSTGTGANLILNLLGYYGSTHGEPELFTYCFNVTKYYTSPIPYSLIKGLNSISLALDIATIEFNSPGSPAKITISSDSAGENTTFRFQATEGAKTIPYFLAFKATLPEAEVTAITEPDNIFFTDAITATSPIGGTTTSHKLEGKIKLYTDAATPTPATGTYSSKIYLIIEPDDTI